MKITRTGEREFLVESESGQIYTVANGHCSCPARGDCKHARTARGCNGLATGASVELAAVAKHVDAADADYGDPDHGFSDEEFRAARQGRAAYSRFLGY
jgi:hypothetical protein